MAWRKILLPLGLSGSDLHEILRSDRFSLPCCLQRPRKMFTRNSWILLKEQNQKGCDTSYVGGYVPVSSFNVAV